MAERSKIDPRTLEDNLSRKGPRFVRRAESGSNQPENVCEPGIAANREGHLRYENEQVPVLLSPSRLLLYNSSLSSSAATKKPIRLQHS